MLYGFGFEASSFRVRAVGFRAQDSGLCVLGLRFKGKCVIFVMTWAQWTGGYFFLLLDNAA